MPTLTECSWASPNSCAAWNLTGGVPWGLVQTLANARTLRPAILPARKGRPVTRAIHECTYPCSMGVPPMHTGVPPMHTGETPVLHPVVNCSRGQGSEHSAISAGCRLLASALSRPPISEQGLLESEWELVKSEWELVKSERSPVISGRSALGACLSCQEAHICVICTTISSFFAISSRTYKNAGEKIATEDTENTEKKNKGLSAILCARRSDKPGLEVRVPHKSQRTKPLPLPPPARGGEPQREVLSVGSNAPVEATSLAKLFGLYARVLQTLCRNRSIIRQNVSEDDCLPFCRVTHNILAIGHLREYDGLDAKEKRALPASRCILCSGARKETCAAGISSILDQGGT